MSNYRYSSDLINDALFRTGEPTDGTSDFQAQGLQYLNRAYQIIQLGGMEIDLSVNESWWWLEKSPPGTLTLQPKLTGNASVTNKSAGITFSAAPTPAIDLSLASGWFLRVNSQADVFRVKTHVSGGVAATLDSVYTGPTATAAAFTAFKLEYALATDVLRPLSPMRVYQDNQSEIDGVDQASLDRDYPLRLVEGGIPAKFAFVGERRVRFSHWGGASGTKLVRVEVPYLRRLADLTNSASEEPAVPMPYRRVLSDITTYFLFVDKNDARADTAGLTARAGLKAMARENRYRLQAFSRTNAQILPRPGQTRRMQAPLRTESGLILG